MFYQRQTCLKQAEIPRRNISAYLRNILPTSNHEDRLESQSEGYPVLD